MYGIETTNREPFLVLKELLEGISTNLQDQFGKSPSFSFGVNNIILTNDAIVTIPITNDSQALYFSVRNTGNATADDPTLSVVFPKELNVIPSGNGWFKGSSGTVINNTKLVWFDDKQFSIEGHRSVAPRNVILFDAITVQATNLASSCDGILVFVASKNSAGFRNSFLLHFTNGIGEAHLGY